MNTRARTLDLDTVWLQPGQHNNPGDKPMGNIPVMCLMEVISYVSGEAWSDRPRCVSPLLVGFGRGINDLLDPHARQRLKPLIPRFIGTNVHPEQSLVRDHERTYVCARYLLRTWLPDYLYRHDRRVLELKVRGLAAVVDDESAAAVRDELRAMRVSAWASGHLIGQAIDRTMMVMTQMVSRGPDDIGHRNVGSLTAEAYFATHTDTNWDEAFEFLDELLQVSNG